jgi:nucleoside-diphosphate-sugar epimerase
MTEPGNKKNVLVTGGRGYVGTHLMGLLGKSAQSWDTRPGADYRNCISTFTPGRLKQPVDAVVHLADQRLQDLDAGNWRRNVECHRGFFARLRDLRGLRKVIFASSCSVYGSNDQMISEDSPVNPTSAYAESKLETERLLRESGLPHTILRFGTAYGWSEEMRHDLLVNMLARAVVKKEPVKIFAPDARRPFIHCQDFASALAHELSLDGGRILNVAEGNFSKREIVQVIEAITGQEINIEPDSRPDPRNYSISRERALASGYTCRRSLAHGAREMLERYA